jgi:hypothetical protein
MEDSERFHCEIFSDDSNQLRPKQTTAPRRADKIKYLQRLVVVSFSLLRSWGESS